MSFASTALSISSTSSRRGGAFHIFQDLPVLEKATLLTVIELRVSDKQIIDELVYRWCRILTRPQKGLPSITQENCTPPRKVLIIDLIGAVSPIRLGSILKRDDTRLKMIGLVRGCTANSTHVTIRSHLDQTSGNSNLKLIVIYQDEFFIFKTLELLESFMKTNSKCQIVLIVPRLSRRDRDFINLVCPNQVLKCDFSPDKPELGALREIIFQRQHPNKYLPTTGELKDDGLHLNTKK